MKLTSFFSAVVLTAFSLTSFAQDVGGANKLKELRYCGVPTRSSSGAVTRDQSVLNAFQKIHPCPSTGKTTGSCTGWILDHIVPRAAGGCDAVSNLQWQPKTGSEDKDNWECQVYGKPEVYDNIHCKSALPLKK